MADPVGISLAVLSTIDLCIKYGKKLVERYRAFKSADRVICELILQVEHHWIKFEYQIKFLQRVWNDLDQDRRLQIHQHHLLQTLHVKLVGANNLLDGVIGVKDLNNTINSLMRKKGDIHRGRYALSLEDSLKQSVNDLKVWHDMFDPSWFLISRVPSQKIDDQLIKLGNGKTDSVSTLRYLRDAIRANQAEPVQTSGNSIWVESDYIVPHGEQIQRSGIELANTKNGSRKVLIDTILVDDQANFELTTREVRDLARVLSKSDPHIFGLLPCLGVIKGMQMVDNLQRPKFELLYSIPDGLNGPTSLRKKLRSSIDKFSLNERFSLAKCIASSVMYIHSSKFVHKNIRPETTIVFSNDESQLASPFLVGFEKFRSVDGKTYRRGDSSMEKNLYRHPSRQGLQPEEDYIMQHDIYSLGVLLLEIGLWVSFVEQDNSCTSRLNPVLKLDDILTERNERKKSMAIKLAFIDLASTQLASKMGRKYTDVVLTCLTCLDKSDNKFGNEDEFTDEDGIVVGIRYVEKVLLELQEISV